MSAINPDFNRTIRDKVDARARTRHPHQEIRLPGTVHKPWEIVAAPERPAEECLHHWVIETPNGAFSAGHCKRCGAERRFRNSSEFSFGNENFGQAS